MALLLPDRLYPSVQIFGLVFLGAFGILWICNSLPIRNKSTVVLGICILVGVMSFFSLASIINGFETSPFVGEGVAYSKLYATSQDVSFNAWRDSFLQKEKRSILPLPINNKGQIDTINQPDDAYFIFDHTKLKTGFVTTKTGIFGQLSLIRIEREQFQQSNTFSSYYDNGLIETMAKDFDTVKPGDVAVIDLTIYDVGGNPIVTTDKQLFKQETAQRKFVLFSNPISVISNQSLAYPFFLVQRDSTVSGRINQFAFSKPEYDAMSSGIFGMVMNEQKLINIPSSTSMTQLLSLELLNRNGVNINDINEGDVLSMEVSNNTEEMTINQSIMTYMRVGVVSRKTPEGVVVDFGYPTVDIRVVSINGNN